MICRKIRESKASPSRAYDPSVQITLKAVLVTQLLLVRPHVEALQMISAVDRAHEIVHFDRQTLAATLNIG